MSAMVFEDVSVAFGERKVLRGVTASFVPGRITGIVGPNGAGKTTLLRAGLGLQKISGGTIRIKDRSLAQWPRQALARAIAYLPQGGDARWPMTAAEVVMLGRLPHRTHFGAPEMKDKIAVAEALSRADAAVFAERRMDELSAGERARVLFARALATGADILIADEPAAYLDPCHQLRLMELLREEAARGTAVAITLHDLSLASAYCDHVIVVSEGSLAAEGDPRQALSDVTLAKVFQIARSEGHGAYRRL